MFLWETTFTRYPRPRQKPLRVIAAKVYNGDPLLKRLRQRGIELNLSAQEESRSDQHARRPSAAALPHVLDRGTQYLLGGKLPPVGGVLRQLAPNLPRVLSYRLPHDRPTEGCAIA